MSRYLNELLEAAANGRPLVNMPSAKNAVCLVELCERFAPTYAKDMAERCEGVDQPKALNKILEAIAENKISMPQILGSCETCWIAVADDPGDYRGKGKK